MKKSPHPESTAKSRTKDGRWKKGASGNPSGRPVENPARRLLMANAEQLTQTAINLALAGDTTALNACLARIAPPLKGQAAPIQLEMPASGNLLDQAQRILQAATDGTIAPDIAGQLMQALSTMAKVREIDELEQRLAELERSLEK
ncbi:DUF5681 domain-containing protein [Geoalkalibacter subterraneus]|jgi:hypothetical protein|uniref:DUF5681 domain-containing protein n=1 Tax=Geoalkalibacter subterraneus TaxID=483547 RepID=UPI000694F601|nr:hypothetical protein [Geoalkalibacter subterraneus]